MTPEDLAAAVRRVTWTGLFINIGLAGVKMAAGVLGSSQALVADSIHSTRVLPSSETGAGTQDIAPLSPAAPSAAAGWAAISPAAPTNARAAAPAVPLPTLC